MQKRKKWMLLKIKKQEIILNLENRVSLKEREKERKNVTMLKGK